MAILFTADIHIKLGQKNVPIEWAKNRYDMFISQIGEIVDRANIDLHIVGGDVFDRIPTLEELEVYFKFVNSCTVPTLIYDGNHEATRKHETFLKKLADVTSAINPKVEIITTATEFADRGFTILPYCQLHKVNMIENICADIPLFTHVRGEIPPHVTPEINLDRLSKFPVVFAGDLHSHDNCQRNIVYPGSPMTTSFHRSKVETGALVILDDWDWYWERFKLPQLLRFTVSNEKDMKPGTYDHIIYELEGDLSELANIKSNQLLDKKVVKRNSEASLILGKDMSIGDELIEYLTYILQINEERTNSILRTYNDYAKNS